MSGMRILVGDVREKLAELPDESVHCAVTSPPYWGLRDYGVTGQIGLEPSLGEHLAVMVDVFREVRRVLRKDGTLWLNYGDCYATAPNGRSAADTKAAGNDDRTFRDKPFSTVGPVYAKDSKARGRATGKEAKWHNGEPTADGRICAGGYLKPKDLCMVPNRLAIALQEDGWWVRSEIIWAKPNPMPESIKDRPTTAHEKLWLLSKSERYFYDWEQVLEACSVPDWDNGTRVFGGINKHGANAKHGDRTTGRLATRQRGQPPRHEQYNTGHRTLDEYPRDQGRNVRNVWEVATRPFDVEMCRSCRTVYSRAEYRALKRYEDDDEKVHVVCRCGRDDEWLSHFATFPPALIEPCIKAGCPAGGTVLDPFGGAGTTGLVANRLGRDAILIELNADYAEMARRRIEGDAPMFAKVEVEREGEGRACA